MKHLCAVSKSSYSGFSCGTTITSLAGAAIGTLGLASSVRLFSLGRTHFTEKKEKLNQEFNRKLANPALARNTSSKDAMSAFYKLTPDEQKDIPENLTTEVSSMTQVI